MHEILETLAPAQDAERERPFEEQWIPAEAIAPIDTDSAEGILAGLERIDLRWRLDAIDVLAAYLDEPADA